MAEKKVYGLIMPKKKGQLKNTSVTSVTRNVFGDDSDDDEKKPTTVVGPFGQTQTNNKMKRQTQMDIDKALQENPDIYEYDNIYDDMQASKPKVGVKEKEKSVKERQPKYISNLLKAAEVKKKEEERRKERQVQKEREAEGAQYADKESFVTGAYKKKMLEMQAEEEEEKRKAQIDDMTEVTKQKDMSGFYRYLYKSTTGDVKPDVKPDVAAVTKDEPDKTESANNEPTIKEEPKSPSKHNAPHSGSGSDSDSEKDKSKPDGTFAKRTKGNNFRKRHASSSDSDSSPPVSGREAKSVPNARQSSPSHRSRHSPQLHRRKRSRSKSPAQRRKRTRSRSKSPAKRNKKSTSKSPSSKQRRSSPNSKSPSQSQQNKSHLKSIEPEDRDRSVSPKELSSSLVENGNEENQPISDGNIQTNLKEMRNVSGTGSKTDKVVKIDPAKKVYPHHNSKKDIDEAKKRYLIRKIAREHAKMV